MPHWLPQSHEYWHAFWTRGVQAAIVVNLVPYYMTYKAYHGDGYELVGWPIAFFKRGGFSGTHQFQLVAVLVDVACGVTVALLTALVLKDGFAMLLYRLRTWGLEEHSVPLAATRGQTRPDLSLSLSTTLWILAGACVSLGLDRWTQPTGYGLLMYSGFLILAGFLSNKVCVVMIGVAISLSTIFLPDYFGL